MKVFLHLTMAVLVSVFLFSFQAGAQQQGVCLKVNGEKVEILHLADKALVIDRDGIPDFAATSMLEAVTTGKETKSYNLILTKVKRNPQKAISSFELKVDEKTYFYPQDACAK